MICMSSYQERYPRWPDFHCWLPNQAFRREAHSKQKMMQDIDKLLEEASFPLERFYGLMGEWVDYSKRMRNIFVNSRHEGRVPTKSEERELDNIEAYYKEVMGRLDELIDPVYQQMLDMGYSPRELRYLS